MSFLGLDALGAVLLVPIVAATILIALPVLGAMRGE